MCPIAILELHFKCLNLISLWPQFFKYVGLHIISCNLALSLLFHIILAANMTDKWIDIYIKDKIFISNFFFNHSKKSGRRIRKPTN